MMRFKQRIIKCALWVLHLCRKYISMLRIIIKSLVARNSKGISRGMEEVEF
jgi:hypothetical protein